MIKTTLRPGELAERWNCSTGWLANLRCAGLGPAYLKLGGRFIAYRVEDVESYEAESLVGGGVA